MSGPYRSLAKEFFPNAKIICDRFHVVKLLTPHINRTRKEHTGDDRKNPIRRLLLSNRRNLEYYERGALDRWLKDKPTLKELYEAKETLSNFYRIKGKGRAERHLNKFCKLLAATGIKELETLRKTLTNWKKEILNFFDDRLTNGRTEGFNNKLSLVKRRAYGYRSFENFRLRALNACL